MLLTSTGEPIVGYQGRIRVSQSHVTLSAVTGADEGSYTVRDVDGKIKNKLCLNVRGERTNEDLTSFSQAAAPSPPPPPPCQDVCFCSSPLSDTLELSLSAIMAF